MKRGASTVLVHPVCTYVTHYNSRTRQYVIASSFLRLRGFCPKGYYCCVEALPVVYSR